MSKLSIDALRERAGAVASIDLLNSISGGIENSCHESTACLDCQETAAQTQGAYNGLGHAVIHWLFH